MPSHLTRHVFRRLLANEPLVFRGCLRRQAYSTHGGSIEVRRRSFERNGVQAVAREQRRGFFGLNMFGPKKRETKEADIDPGMEDMMHLEKVQRMRARLPPAEHVSAAVKKFFAYKASRRESISDTQARLALNALRYLLSVKHNDSHDVLSLRTISSKIHDPICKCLKVCADRPAQAHIDLGQLALEQAPNRRMFLQALNSLVTLLGGAGQGLRARELVLQLEDKGPRFSTDRDLELDANDDAEEVTGHSGHFLSDPKASHIWGLVLKGVAKSNDEQELLTTLGMVRDRAAANAWKAIPHIEDSMLDFYLRTTDSVAVKRYFEDLNRVTTELGPGLLAKYVHLVLQWCLRNNELEYGHQVVRQSTRGNPPKQIWDSIFVWAAGTGKGAEEIGRMMDVMQKSNEDIPSPDEWRLPDIKTINGLIEYATNKQDPYLAERFIALGQARGIEPDAQTYQLQMEYRLKINDVDGALIAYKNLQTMDISSNEDVPTVNKLLVALCRSKRHDFDTVMNVAMDLSDRKVAFEPETVSTLALLHLSRDELPDVVDLLNTHANHYSSTDRKTIRDTILEFSLNPATPTSRSWDAYTIIRTTFDETTRDQRTEMMKNFFDRERTDMAVHIFNEMRRHSRIDTMPTVDTYVAAFLGAAKCRDLNSLEVLHNQMKLDYNINVNTYLINALIIAYTACGEARKAVTFWSDIAASREGPTYNSIHIVLRACERAPFGDLRAQEIWDKLRKMKIDLDQSMWASYIAALAGNGDNELAIKTVEEAEQKMEVEVDAFLVGSLYDGANNEAKKKETEQWAKEKYPEVWEELEKIGYQDNEEDVLSRRFKIDRSVTP